MHQHFTSWTNYFRCVRIFKRSHLGYFQSSRFFLLFVMKSSTHLKVCVWLFIWVCFFIRYSKRSDATHVYAWFLTSKNILGRMRNVQLSFSRKQGKIKWNVYLKFCALITIAWKKWNSLYVWEEKCNW